MYKSFEAVGNYYLKMEAEAHSSIGLSHYIPNGMCGMAVMNSNKTTYRIPNLSKQIKNNKDKARFSLKELLLLTESESMCKIL